MKGSGDIIEELHSYLDGYQSESQQRDRAALEARMSLLVHRAATAQGLLAAITALHAPDEGGHCRECGVEAPCPTARLGAGVSRPD